MLQDPRGEILQAVVSILSSFLSFSPIRVAAAVSQPVPALVAQGANLPRTSARSHLWLQEERRGSRRWGRLPVFWNARPLTKLPVSLTVALFRDFRISACGRLKKGFSSIKLRTFTGDWGVRPQTLKKIKAWPATKTPRHHTHTCSTPSIIYFEVYLQQSSGLSSP